ncbi:MAG: (d)CMP kinase [Candidatus Neomarinimicrobiota bacterium]|nr:MAG: (d)CMP kinase [Candidatus Neomarinimicrobiota bacterium]
MIIAIDGPAASGKSTTAKLVAERSGFSYLDTGAMYRAVTYAVLQSRVDLADEQGLAEWLALQDITQRWEKGTCRVYLNGTDITAAIRSPEVTRRVSEVSAIPVVRQAMVRLQRTLAAQGDYVVEGRDIGTVVFPDAEWKFFLVADDETRAKRRQKDLEQLGIHQDISELVREIQERDRKDSSRAHSPLRKAADAIEVDTSHLTIAEQVQFILNQIKQPLTKETS